MRASFRRRSTPMVVLWAITTTFAPAPLLAWVGNGVPLCAQGSIQSVPTIATDGAGGAIVGWVDLRSGSADIYAQRIDSTGAPLWTLDGVGVCVATGGQSVPALLPSSGGAVAFWRDGRLGTSALNVYGQRLDGAGSSLWTPNGIILASTHTSGVATDLAAISDNSSGVVHPTGWIVAWRNGLSGFMTIQVQHVDASGSGMWTSPDVGGVALAVPALGDVGPFAMTTDGVGIASAPKGAVVAWSQSQGTVNGFDVYARRVSGGGVPQWPQEGVPLCALNGDQDRPDIAQVGGGSTIVVWRDARTSDVDLYAQKLNSSGVVQWLDGGLPVSRAAGTVDLPKLTSDGAGGVVIVWEDYRSGTSQIYAQRLDGAGQPLWDVDGIPVSPTTTGEGAPQVVSDGAGGAIVVWVDVRAGSNVFAQRLDPNGNRLWLTGGVPLSSTAPQLTALDIIGNGASGVLATWIDSRNGNPDVFANRVVASGGVVGVDAPPTPAGLRLSLASANPTLGALGLRLELPARTRVDADVFDAGGRHVRALATGALLDAGTNELAWNARDDTGGRVPAGVYFVRVRAGAERSVVRVVALH